MAGYRYTLDECILGLEAYIKIKGQHISESNEILIDLTNYYHHMGKYRPVKSTVLLMSNCLYLETGTKGMPNASQALKDAWNLYYLPATKKLDEELVFQKAAQIRVKYGYDSNKDQF